MLNISPDYSWLHKELIDGNTIPLVLMIFPGPMWENMAFRNQKNPKKTPESPQCLHNT